MKVLFMAPQWGFEHLPFEAFLHKIIDAGFDGLDTWVPDDANKRREFINLLSAYSLPIVCHQHQAAGNNIDEFCRSFEYQLNLCMECNPILINSHSGRDYFELDDQLKVIDTASNFAAKHNITIAHETHRGRIGYSPYNVKTLFKLRPDMQITADLSHWVCVTESYLEHSTDIVNHAIEKTAHIHARVGHPQGPQVPDPRAEQWQYAQQKFMSWWAEMISCKRKQGNELLTITPEFGPPPYMPIDIKSGLPIADQFGINKYIKEKIKKELL